MERWRLIDLGMAEPIIAQTFYEAVAKAVSQKLSPNTIILVQPSKPYVCIGYHQILENEVDINYCKKNNLQIIRRSQGGGAVYLDSNQVFYQVIAHEDSEVIPKSINTLFQKLLQVTVYVYRELGLNAEYKPINDVMVNNRKISGNGAGKLDNAIILVGNIILDLNYEMMARILKVPDEKFRDKMAKSMREWVTSLKRELGYIPPINKIKNLLVKGYEEVLGIKLIKAEPTDIEKQIFEKEIKPKHLSREWLYMPEYTHKTLTLDRAVKIADGIKIVDVVHKAKKLIRITAELSGEKINDIMITGDFFIIPSDAITKIEEELKGVHLDKEKLEARIKDVIKKHNIEIPGIDVKDLIDAILKLRKYTEKYPEDLHPYAEV